MLKQTFIHELLCQAKYQRTTLDILIVVKDQLFHLQNCIKSILSSTHSDFNIFIWDNGSREDVRLYLDDLVKTSRVQVFRSEENLGFLVPNNRLVSKGKSEYICLINSDVTVSEGWDSALIGFLQNNEHAIVGFEGIVLNKECVGVGTAIGEQIDVISGWSLCFRRKLLEKFVLFDEENLAFAYCEDADFCLRVKESGLKIYALNLKLAHHHCNATIREVKHEIDLRKYFIENHVYMKKRWGKFLSENRILIKYPEKECNISPEQVVDQFYRS